MYGAYLATRSSKHKLETMPERVPVIGDYRILGRMGEGTFSEVLKCQSLVDGRLYACKKMKQKYDNLEQVNNLREIQALRRLNPHTNIIQLSEVMFDRHSGTLSLIFEIMDMNIYELIKDRRSYLQEPRIKLYMYQLCKAIYHMHRNGIFHRDVKPENILIKNDVLKLADFGSCKSMYSKQPYTEYISTRWYRAPECLLTDGHYGYKMDLWSVGCVLYEIMSLRPLFPGSNELDQISKIHDVLGSPTSAVLEKFRKIQSKNMDFNFPYKPIIGISLKNGSRLSVDLISKLCLYDPADRITARDALRHPFFKELREAERRSKQRMPESSSTLLSPKIGKSQQHQSQYQKTHYHKQAKIKPKNDFSLVSLKPKEFSLPFIQPHKVSNNVSLPRITGKPSYHGHHHSHYSSGLSSGLPPPLPHTTVKAPTHLSTFPPILLQSEFPSGKTSIYSSAHPSLHHPPHPFNHPPHPLRHPPHPLHHPPHPLPSHLPSMSKHAYGTVRMNLH